MKPDLYRRAQEVFASPEAPLGVDGMGKVRWAKNSLGRGDELC
jgi:hypothetical protein